MARSTSSERASKAANAGSPTEATMIVTSPTARSGDRIAQPRRSGSRLVPNDSADDRGPGRERAPGHDEGEDPGPAGRPGGRVEGREGEHDHARVADDRVPDDVLEVVLDPGRERGQDDRGGRDGDDDRALRRRRRPGVARSTRRPRRWPTMASEAGPEGEEDRQPGLRDGVGQPRDDDVERDDAEPDRHGEREREVGEPEHDRLGDEVLQVAPDPGRRGDRHRAGDHHRPQVPQADPGPDPRARRARSSAGRRASRRP